MAVYKIGSIGESVKQIQKALGLKADGIFGRGTEAAVKKFQKENGLLADGIVGKKTLEKLMSNMDTDLSPVITPVKLLDIENYYLPKKEYLNGKYNNEYIILHHTAGWDDPKQVVDSWAKDSLGRVATEFVVGGQRSTDGRNTFDGKIVRSYPEGNQAYHIGASGSSYMNTHSVGIEMCNMGWVKNGKTYVNTYVKPDQIITLKEPFRGYMNWHKYSDKQLNALHDLLLYIAKRDNIDLHRGIYQWIKTEGAAKAFEFHQDAYYGRVKGMVTHGNIRKDKFDMSPQPNLIDMILTL
jgi:N-acetyl-anhydromuramyl-L-alanine amidase AmpD